MQANAYVTPPQNQGFSALTTTYNDVFVLQIAERSDGGYIRLCWYRRYAISLGTTARLMWRNGPRNLP